MSTDAHFQGVFEHLAASCDELGVVLVPSSRRNKLKLYRTTAAIINMPPFSNACCVQVLITLTNCVLSDLKSVSSSSSSNGIWLLLAPSAATRGRYYRTVPQSNVAPRVNKNNTMAADHGVAAPVNTGAYK